MLPCVTLRGGCCSIFIFQDNMLPSEENILISFPFSFFFFLWPAGSTSVCDPSTEVACRNHPSICIELERVQDGVADCPDASDEGESNIHSKKILIIKHIVDDLNEYSRLALFTLFKKHFGLSELEQVDYDRSFTLA